MNNTQIDIVYVVNAYKYGLCDLHSYTVGVYKTKRAAKTAAYKEVANRGGKYGCEVLKCSVDCKWDEQNDLDQVYYVESPYFGMLGNGTNIADRSTEHWKEKRRKAIEMACKAKKNSLKPMTYT